MIELNDDIFKYIGPHNPLVVTTNNVIKSDGRLVMGAGIAKLVKNRFPEIDEILGMAVSSTKGRDYNIIYSLTGNQPIIALQTKRHWKDPSPIDLVIRSCQRLLEFINKNEDLNVERIYMTRPGCGNGGLDWNYVKPLISFLDDRFVVCHKD